MLNALRLSVLAVAASCLMACTGTSAVRVNTNGPADISVDGQYLGQTGSAGQGPVLFPLPWRNVDNQINYSQRRLTVKADGKVVFDRDISGDVAAKAQTGDYKDGSVYGSGRTYDLIIDIHATTQPGR